MKLLSILILLIFSKPIFIPKLHPVHISITNIDYNENKSEFDLSIKLFSDDFEKIINKSYKTNINLSKENESDDCNLFIDKYIKHHLILKINNKNLIRNIKLFKKKVNQDENFVWLFYKISYPQKKLSKGKKIEVVNILMNDLYNDQKNLFIFTYKNTKEGYNFEKNKINFEFFLK